jgi:hypothetical protein
MIKASAIDRGRLPGNCQDIVAHNIAPEEQIVLCIMVQDTGPLLGHTDVVILTDYRLFLIYGITYANTQPMSIGLEKIKEITLDQPWFGNKGPRGVLIDHGAKIDGEPDLLKIRFDDKALVAKFEQELKKMVAQAFVRARTPRATTKLPDIGDQIAKLAQLRHDQLLTESQYQAALNKLLS